jgi:aspartyl protease family protein
MQVFLNNLGLQRLARRHARPDDHSRREDASMSRDRVLRALGFVFVVILAGAGPALQAEDTPDDTLKAKGLRRVSAFYVLPAEADLAKKLSQLRGLLNELTFATARQQAMEAEGENSKKLVETYSQQRRMLRQQLPSASSVAEQNQVIETMNELGDRINMLIRGSDNAEAVKKQSSTVAHKREAYVQALLDTRSFIDEAKKNYTDLGQDEAVKTALAKLNETKKSPIKLGPTRTYESNVKLFEKLESGLLTETISLHDDHGVFMVDTILNGKVSKPMIFDTGASLMSIPPDLAGQLGLKPGDDTPTIKLETASGAVVEGKLMTLDSVRVGKFQVENVRCAVLPESLSKAPPLLGGTFLRNFVYKITPETGKLTLSKVNTATPEKPSGRTAKKKK